MTEKMRTRTSSSMEVVVSNKGALAATSKNGFGLLETTPLFLKIRYGKAR